MEANERKENSQMLIDKNAQINLVLSQPYSDEGEIHINLGRVIDRIKSSKRLYAWVILFCMVVGICATLVMYQVSKPMLTVSSVVTLNYDVEDEPVESLIAPDGEDLELSQILSSYVLQRALEGIQLSAPVTISSLRSNLKIERVLDESSRRTQEIIAKMQEDKNSSGLAMAQNVNLAYDNKFIVSLTNGFGEKDSRNKTMLKDSELPQLLNLVLDSYNDYLVETYANLKLPDDTYAFIDPERLDILENLDQMRYATDNLYSYCKEQPDSVREYRSWKTGLSLNDLMETLQTCKEVDINYLYSYIQFNNIAKDKSMLLLNYRYRLRNAQSTMDTLNENIKNIDDILKSYKNDKIVVSLVETDVSNAYTVPTEYYNQLIKRQTENFKQAAKNRIRVEELSQNITKLSDASTNSFYEVESREVITKELDRSLADCKTIYSQIKSQMEEILTSPFYTHYIDRTDAIGEQGSFLSDNLTKIVIGAVAGAVIGCGVWFMSAFLPELHQSSRRKENRGEAVA